MTLKVGAWNVARGLSTQKAPEILEYMQASGVDVLIVSEAFDKRGEPGNFRTHMKRHAPDYQHVFTPYKDRDPHPSEEQYVAMLVAKKCTERKPACRPIRLGTRNGLDLRLEDKRVIGAHFDDRTEAYRVGMAKAVIGATRQDEQVVLGGDLNAMHGEDRWARLISSNVARKAAGLVMPSSVRSFATRLTDMGTGTTLELLTKAGLEDADPKHQSTQGMAGIRFNNLDHFMQRGFAVSDFAARPNGKLSDHGMITALFSVASAEAIRR